MATNYGDLYNQAQAAWDAQSQDAKLQQLGFRPTYTDGFGYDIPSQYQVQFSGGGDGSNDAQLRDSIARVTQFDKQKFFSELGIMPVDPRLTGNGDGGSTPEQIQAYQDNAARSFNQFGFNFQNYEDMLRHTTGDGQMIDDPTLGKVWVPNNRNSQTWNQDYMSASTRQGSGLDRAVMGAMDNGAGVYGAAAGIGALAAGAGLAAGGAGAGGAGGTGAAGSFISDLPTWAGGAAEGLGGGAAGAGLGGAAAPAIGSAVAGATGAGLEAAGGGFLSDLPAWAGGAGGTSLGGAALTEAGKSALSRIIQGQGTAADYAEVAGKLGSTALGYLGAENKANSLNSVADKNLALGAPYRGLLASSYDPNFSMSNEPGYKDALDNSMNSYLRKASTGGNPFTNPGVSTEALKYVTAGTALPQLNTYRSQLGTFGQLGLNTAGTAQLGGANASGGTYDALGYGLGSVTQPDSTLQDLLKKYGSGLFGNSAPAVNTGSSLT